MNRIIYLDNAATTPLSDTAFQAMLPYLKNEYGNPSGFYELSRNAKTAIEESRQKIARALGALPEEIYFTGGGSESDNWALKGISELKRKKGKHIIISSVEHHALLHSAQYLDKQGFELTYLPVDSKGKISLEKLEQSIRDDTVLISIMAANNEIGTIEPIADIGAIAHKHGILFHTDAVQAVGHIPINVNAMNVDLLSLSSHKFNGPKGVGALYIRKGIRLPAFVHGGGQENGVRGGTENVPGIVGMAAALVDAVRKMPEESVRLRRLRDKLIKGVLDNIPYSYLTGDTTDRLDGIASFIFDCVEGEAMVLSLDIYGICASSGSACSSGSLDPSHVLLAIGLPHEKAHGSLRFSLGADTSEEDIERVLEVLPEIIKRLRDMSPLWENKMKGEQK